MPTIRTSIALVVLLCNLIAAGCAKNADGLSQGQTHTVTASASVGGNVTPASVSVIQGESTALAVTPNTGYRIVSVLQPDAQERLRATPTPPDPLPLTAQLQQTLLRIHFP